jgi:hypothetical protein
MYDRLTGKTGFQGEAFRFVELVLFVFLHG